MRADLVGLGLAITLLSTSLAHGQFIIDVSKEPVTNLHKARSVSPELRLFGWNGYYHGKNGSTSIDTQQSEAIFETAYGLLPHGGKRQIASNAGAGAPDETQITSCRRPLLEHSRPLPIPRSTSRPFRSCAGLRGAGRRFLSASPSRQSRGDKSHLATAKRAIQLIPRRCHSASPA